MWTSYPEDEFSPAETITRGLLAGEGRYTRLEVAERAGVALDEARRLWRALGFPEVDDEQRVFTSTDVAALTDAADSLTQTSWMTPGWWNLPVPWAT